MAIVNNAHFGMQQFWFWDVRAVIIRCKFIIPESKKQKIKNDLLREKFQRPC